MTTKSPQPTPITEWDPMAPLNPGTMLLEASAGTGKTYNLVNWVLRLVVEYDIPIQEQVVVTFTRAATAELKERIRVRLAEAAAVLSNRRPVDPSDKVLARILASAREARLRNEDWLHRVTAAQESFDACLISTIHGFCQRMLQHNAFEAQTDFDLTLVDDASGLHEELVDDWLSSELHDVDAARYGFLVDGCSFHRKALRTITTEALRDPDMDVVPAEGDAPADSPAWHRARFVRWVRSEFDARHQAHRTQSYADLMRKLARVLDKNDANPSRRALVQAVRSRYQVALIDEFQDTDALQWSIFRALFTGPGQRLYLIGDPKQAIYGFRGANVHVYLKAKRDTGDRTSTITTNYRSDQRLVEALNHLLNREGIFGEKGIEYEPVRAAVREKTPVDRLVPSEPWSAASTAPLQLRFIDQRIAGANEVSDEDGRVTRGLLAVQVPRRVADDVVALLQSGTRLFVRRDPHTGRDDTTPVEPGDIAVLTRTSAQANAIQEALGNAGVPAVLMGADSVLASPEAYELQLWLDALARTGNDSAARAAAITHVFGRDAGLLSKLDAEEPAALEAWETWTDRLVQWRKRFEEHGVLSALRRALEEDLFAPDGGEPQDATARLLRRPDGQRRLTNLWHVAELLHGAEAKDRRKLPGLLAWLKQQRADASVDAETAELRLDRDDKAVRLLTMHKAKGLQFPIVFDPYLWYERLPRDNSPVLVVPREGDPSQRVCDVRDKGDREDTFDRATSESRKDAIRLLYVAVTRARVRCIVYLGHVNELENSAVGPVFHGEEGTGTRIERGVERTSRDTPRSALYGDLLRIAKGSVSKLDDGAPTISVTPCTAPEGRTWAGRAPDPRPLSVRDFSRYGLDGGWRRTSYSALTRGKTTTYVDVIEGREGFDPDEEQEAANGEARGREQAPQDSQHPDESADDTANDLPEATSSWVPCIEVPEGSPNVPLAAMRGGADVGTFFHEVFEKADFSWVHPDNAPHDGIASLAGLVRELLGVHGFDADALTEPVLAGLTNVLRTPLRSVLGDVRLCDVARKSRLDELRFDFPIAGGDSFRRGGPRKRVTSEAFVAALSRRLRDDVRPPNDEVTIRATYVRGLAKFGKLAGYMTGSIDMVFRHPTADGPKWFVVDYKSNRLDPLRQGRWPIQHFGPEGMRYEMEQHHYYVQYHLYLLALHRYLRFRLGDAYDYARDVGGVYYLFFRGMLGPETPRVQDSGYGCFFDKPPVQVVDALDTLFCDPSAFEGGAS